MLYKIGGTLITILCIFLLGFYIGFTSGKNPPKEKISVIKKIVRVIPITTVTQQPDTVTNNLVVTIQPYHVIDGIPDSTLYMNARLGELNWRLEVQNNYILQKEYKKIIELQNYWQVNLGYNLAIGASEVMITRRVFNIYDIAINVGLAYSFR